MSKCDKKKNCNQCLDGYNCSDTSILPQPVPSQEVAKKEPRFKEVTFPKGSDVAGVIIDEQSIRTSERKEIGEWLLAILKHKAEKRLLTEDYLDILAEIRDGIVSLNQGQLPEEVKE